MEVNKVVEEAEQDLRIHEAYGRLVSNPDFKRVIIRGYLDRYLRDNLGKLHTTQREAALHAIDGIAALEVYFTSLADKANTAQSRKDEAHMYSHEYVNRI